MQMNEFEPGLLRVFRVYAWLQLISKIIIPLHLLRERAGATLPGPVPFEIGIAGRVLPPDLRWPSAFVLLHLTGLFTLLYWPWLQRRLGQFTIPIALILSAVGIILEQHLFMRLGIFWQLYPFLAILVILVAWQYSFRHVVIFTLATAVLQLGLQVIAPATFIMPPPNGEPQRIPIFGFLFSLPLTFLLLGYIVSLLVSAQRKQRQALAEANRKLVSHAATLEQLTVSRERMRLSRELHDTLAHTLSAMAVQIEAALTLSDTMHPKARSILEQMQGETRSGLGETRRALGALRASPLEDLGLAKALSGLAQDFAARNSLTLTLDVPEEVDDLPQEVEVTCYRVTQEALENVARHARASRLEVSLKTGRSGVAEGRTMPGKAVSLEICDDGEGFQPGESDGRDKFGLTGMKERAELIGARLVIDSGPGRGTAVRMLWEAQ